MKYSITIDNVTTTKWGLKIAEAYLFAWIYALPSWAESATIENETYYFASRNKVIEELPPLTDKPDTVYRYYKKLQDAGLIECIKIGAKDYVRLTKKGS